MVASSPPPLDDSDRMKVTAPCRICKDIDCAIFLDVSRKLEGPDSNLYFECGHCGLVFMDPQGFPSAEVRRDILQAKRFGSDERVKKMASVLDLLLTQLPSTDVCGGGLEGLEYGCGQYPLLSSDSAKGHTIAHFDDMFFNDTALLKKKFDFVVFTGAVELTQDPCDTFQTISNILVPGGQAVFAMSPLDRCTDFSQLAAKTKDNAQVCFFREKTISHLASLMNLDDGSVSLGASGVFVLKKPIQSTQPCLSSPLILPMASPDEFLLSTTARLERSPSPELSTEKNKSPLRSCDMTTPTRFLKRTLESVDFTETHVKSLFQK